MIGRAACLRSLFCEQIVAVLKQAEVGVPVTELIRQVGISEQTLYRWKKQYKGAGNRLGPAVPAAAGRERAAETRLVAELTLDKTMLQDVLSKKFREPIFGKYRDPVLQVAVQLGWRRCHRCGAES
jgi:putative transposase